MSPERQETTKRFACLALATGLIAVSSVVLHEESHAIGLLLSGGANPEIHIGWFGGITHSNTTEPFQIGASAIAPTLTLIPLGNHMINSGYRGLQKFVDDWFENDERNILNGVEEGAKVSLGIGMGYYVIFQELIAGNVDISHLLIGLGHNPPDGQPERIAATVCAVLAGNLVYICGKAIRKAYNRARSD